MANPVRILGICGSLRRQSYNLSALRAAAQVLPDGASLEVFDLNGIPPYNSDVESDPPARVVELKRRLRETDAVLFASPEYNYSVPGGLKDAIDWASRPHGDNAWAGKPAAILGASTGLLGTARAQYHLRQIFVFLNMYAVNQPEVMISRAAERFDAQGNLTDAATMELIRQLMINLVKWTRMLQDAAAMAAVR